MFEIKRGLRQGSPLSALLYILQAGPLAESFRKSKDIMGLRVATSEIRITSYADDTQIFVKNEQSIEEVNRLMEIYSNATGAKINHDKTHGILLGKMKCNVNIRWTKGPIMALGLPQGQTEELEHFWEKKKRKIHQKLELWSRRHLSLTGKVHLAKSLGISIITYAAGLKSFPENKMREINSDLWKFVWSGKSEPIKRTICSQKIEDGGISMPTLQNVVKTRQIMTIMRVISEGDEKWKEVPRRYFKMLDEQYGEEYFLLNAQMSCKEINSIEIPSFYKESLQ